ncbi:Retrotransposon gag domain [Arabidopsis thaliana x Arabidopsis arenosa]|uniref:Retrotransposon gag domain n=1 Tax=Arabidopsis thaliana x Arabidopsis arenosa TaxID=1240361 RepID=A0A8T1YSK6_9BRAS|nr:Retrotransposon gag domain [Arabidopsis thaliana x Arabidopsis arenosa]
MASYYMEKEEIYSYEADWNKDEDEYQGVIEDEDDYGRTTWYDECVSSSDCGEEPDGEELEPEPPDYYHSSQQHTKPHTYTDHTNWVQENSYFCEEDDDADYQYHPPRREEKSHSYGIASYRVQTQSTPAGPTKPTNKRCDYTSNPLIFTGFSKDPKVYLKWENNMKQWLRSNNIPKEEKLYYALSKLKGDAYEWWLKEDAATYYTTKAVLDWGTLKSRMYREFTKKYQPRIRTTKPLYMETPKKVVTTPKLQPIFQPMNAHSHEPRRASSSTRGTPIKAEQFVQVKEVQPDSAATLLHELQGKVNRGASHTMDKTVVLISQETTCCDLDSQAPHQSAITIQEDKTPTLKQETNSNPIGNQGTKDDNKGDTLKSKEFMDQNRNREEYTPLLIKRAANGDENFNETIQIKEKPPDENPLEPIQVTSELQNEFSEQVKEVRSVCQNHYGGYRINFPRFNGVRLSDWLFKAEQFFSLDMTSDDLKVKVASSHFDALAATWHQSIEELILWKHVKHDWVTYKLLLEGKYNKHVEDSIAELKQLQEVDGIDEYHARFELISTRVNLSEAFLVSAYLTGLQIDTQINVRMFGPQSIQQCLMLGRLYEKAHQKKLIIRKDGDDYRKGVMPLNVSSEDAGPLSNIHVPNALHKDRECFEGKHSIQQEIYAGMENFLQQEELTCDSDFVLESDRWCVPYANLKTESVNQEKGELGTGNKGEVKGCLECVSQPQKVNSTFEDFNKANATMNQLLLPIGFVVDNLQSGGGSDIFCDDLQSGGGSDIFRVQTFASPVVVGDFQETPWILNVESKGILIQGELGIVGKIEVDKESVEMLRRCNSGQTIGAYGSEIKRWDINNRVWDPGGW